MLREYTFGDIYIRHAIDDCPDDRSFHMHIHEQCEIYFFVSGNVEYLVEGAKYPLVENNLMVMRPAEIHTPRITGNARYERYAINFPISFVSAFDPQSRLMRAFLDRSLGKDNLFTASELDMVLVRKLFQQMCSEADEYSQRLTIHTHLITLLDMINRAFSERATTKHKPQSTAERMVAYVNRHLFGELSVPELAKHFYLSPSQFSRVFRQATGMAPWEYITKKRLTAAKERIRSGQPAQSVCEACGFGDYSAFYRAYMKHFGCAPKYDRGDGTSHGTAEQAASLPPR